MVKKRKPPETFDEHLAAVVAAGMEKRGKRQEDVAKAIDMPLSNYGRRMRGTNSFTAEELMDIASYLQLDAGAMFQEAIRDFGGAGAVLSEVADRTEEVDEDTFPGNVTQLSRRQSGEVKGKAASHQRKDQDQ